MCEHNLHWPIRWADYAQELADQIEAQGGYIVRNTRTIVLDDRELDINETIDVLIELNRRLMHHKRDKSR